MAAGTTLHLAVEGGASLTLEGGNITFACPGSIKVYAGKRRFNGPIQQYFPLPPFPRNPLPEVAATFDLRLMDVPGPDATALGAFAWRIVRASSQSTALLSQESLLEGNSDADGKLNLSAEQEQALKLAYDQAPNDYWLVFGDQAREVVMEADKGKWSEHQKLLKGLDANGYMSDSVRTGGNGTDVNHIQAARREMQVNSGEALLNKLKEQ